MAKKIEWKFNYVRPQAPETKGFLAIQVERGRFQVTIEWVLRSSQPARRCHVDHAASYSCICNMQVGTIGYGKDNHPPMDHDGYVAFLESFGQPDITEVAMSLCRNGGSWTSRRVRSCKLRQSSIVGTWRLMH